MLKEKIFFASDNIIYLIASTAVADVLIAPLSCFAHSWHLKVLSFMLKWLIFSFCPQILQSLILGLNPMIDKSLSENIA